LKKVRRELCITSPIYIDYCHVHGTHGLSDTLTLPHPILPQADPRRATSTTSAHEPLPDAVRHASFCLPLGLVLRAGLLRRDDPPSSPEDSS